MGEYILKVRILGISIKLIISLRKKMITAKKEPMCKLTSIDRLLLLNFENSEKIIKCEEELTGKNSVTPWIKDKIMISYIEKK